MALRVGIGWCPSAGKWHVTYVLLLTLQMPIPCMVWDPNLVIECGVCRWLRTTKRLHFLNYKIFMLSMVSCLLLLTRWRHTKWPTRSHKASDNIFTCKLCANKDIYIYNTSRVNDGMGADEVDQATGVRTEGYIEDLTHWGRDKMAAIFQTTFLNVFSWMKMYEFRLGFHWNLFLEVQLTVSQHWFR